MAEKPIKISLQKIDPQISIRVPRGAHGSIESNMARGSHDMVLGSHDAAIISLPATRAIQKIKIEVDEAGNIGLSIQ